MGTKFRNEDRSHLWGRGGCHGICPLRSPHLGRSPSKNAARQQQKEIVKCTRQTLCQHNQTLSASSTQPPNSDSRSPRTSSVRSATFQRIGGQVPHSFSFQGVDVVECSVHIPALTFQHLCHPALGQIARRSVCRRGQCHWGFAQRLVVRRCQRRWRDVPPMHKVGIHSLCMGDPG